MSWLSVHSDYKMSFNKKRSYTEIEAVSNILLFFKKNADISILDVLYPIGQKSCLPLAV